MVRGRCLKCRDASEDGSQMHEKCSSSHIREILLCCCSDLLDCIRVSFGDLFVLLRALRATHANASNNFITEPNGNSSLERREIRRQSGHREATFVNERFEIAGGPLEQDSGFCFPDGDFGTAQEGIVQP